MNHPTLTMTNLLNLTHTTRKRVSTSPRIPHIGSSVLRFSGGTPPRRRGDVRRVWLSPRHRRLCYLPPAGELGAASPDCVPATAVLGIFGLLGPGVGAVLALMRPPTQRPPSIELPPRRCQQRADASTQAQWIGNQD